MKRNQWWKNAIVYQIYPRSFQDSNGDGIGDLRGIISRLDYISELGADVIWLCPVYQSPDADNGYDISDYYAINPEFGTMEDFELLLSEAHRRNIRIIMDLVVNHTSDEHEWFIKARTSREDPYYHYYIWENSIPNQWKSWFGGPAWEWNQKTESYYLHIFDKKQPDLNWENLDVREEIYHMMTWWLNKGVDGFRMDVISLISKPADIPHNEGSDLSKSCVNGPRVHEYLQEMNRRVLSRYDIMTVGECPDVTVDEALLYTENDREELNMVFQFEHTGLTDGKYGKWTAQKPYLPELKRVFQHWQRGLQDKGWNCLFWGNHDQPRAVSKFGSDLPEYRDLSAKMLCLCLYLMQGTPFLYQGEELGMCNAGFSSLSQYRDVESVRAYHEFVDQHILEKQTMLDYLAHVSRDNARTPMQWSDSENGGFSFASPWIEMGKSWKTVNAEREKNDPNSVLTFYKKILHYRKNRAIIRDGDFNLLWQEHEQLFAYVRTYRQSKIYVICNFSKEAVSIPERVWGSASLLFTNYHDFIFSDTLRAYEAIALLEIKSQ